MRSASGISVQRTSMLLEVVASADTLAGPDEGTEQGTSRGESGARLARLGTGLGASSRDGT